MVERPYLIWSNEHEAWWRPDSSGYTRIIGHAGRYSAEDAAAICRDGGRARAGSTDAGPYEVAVLAPDAPAPRIAELEACAEKAEAAVARLSGPTETIDETLDRLAAEYAVAALDLTPQQVDRCAAQLRHLMLMTAVVLAQPYKKRAEAAEAEFARLRAAGTFNEGIEAAVAHMTATVGSDHGLRARLRRPETGGL